MGKTLAERAHTAIQNLQASLRAYATGRPPRQFVGQFLDDDGRLNDQYGIYGMGSWVALADDDKSDFRYEPPILNLTSACRQELRRLVEAATSGSREKNAVYLRTIVPKMCYAHLGLAGSIDFQDAASRLSSMIASAQKHDNSWGYMVDSSSGCPEVTALVVRSFAADHALTKHIADAVSYLRGVHGTIQNKFLQLYVLNTLVPHGNGQQSSDIKKGIKKVVSELLTEAFFNPSQFPNPINLDFNDAARTRYIRLSTDVILLESLTLVSGPHRLYVRGHPGRRVFGHMAKVMESPPVKDGTGHRLTPPAALYLYQCLQPLTSTRQWHGIPGIVDTLTAFASCSWSFGVNLGWNLLALAACGLGFALSDHYAAKMLTGAFAGGLAKSGLDSAKNVFNSLFRFGRD